MSQSIKISTLKECINHFTCASWTNSIYSILKENCTKKDEEEIEIPEMYIQLLNNKGTDAMKKFVEGLGISLAEDKNGFILKFAKQPKCIREVSYLCFGMENVFEISDFATEAIGRNDLKGRGFYVNSLYEVILHKIINGGTVLEIVKK